MRFSSNKSKGIPKIMALKQQLDEIESKLRLLKFTIKKTNGILETNDEEVAIRQKGQMTKIILAISDLKQVIEEKKLIKGDSEENVAAWGESIEENIALADENAKQLNEHIQFLKADKRRKESTLEFENKELLDEENYARQQAFEKLKRDKQLAFEQELFNQKLQYQKKIKEVQARKISSTKLPKIVITPFNGSYHDWLRFWGQFSAGINLADIPDVMKFSYLKKLVEPKIRTCIDELPFTAEGYKKAKKILEDKYGNTSEIVNSYVEEIVNLPTVTSTRPEKIHPFYEKLVYFVQSLEPLGRLQEVNGYVRLTLNKLPGIRGDLELSLNGKTGHSQIWLKHCVLGLKEILLSRRQAAKGKMHQGVIRPVKQTRNLEDVYIATLKVTSLPIVTQ